MTKDSRNRVPPLYTTRFEIAFLSLFTLVGCSDNGPLGFTTFLPEDPAIFASIDGNETELWIFDPATLELADRLTLPTVPWSIQFSPDYSEWYTIMNYGSAGDLLAINTLSKETVRQAHVQTSMWLAKEPQTDLLIAFGYRETQFLSRTTFSLVHSESLGFGLELVVPSPNEPKIYAAYLREFNGQAGFAGIMIYNTETFLVEEMFDVIDDSLLQAASYPCDLAISPTGEHLFLTTISRCYPGMFHVIDLRDLEVVAEHLCGEESQIGVSHDGNFVYLTDPASTLNQILRFNVSSMIMEVFVNGLAQLGLEGNVFRTDHVIVAPEDRAIFVSLHGDARIPGGDNTQLIKIDVLTKQVIAHYSIPRDYRGYITSEIKRLELGKYTINASTAQGKEKEAPKSHRPPEEEGKQRLDPEPKREI